MSDLLVVGGSSRHRGGAELFVERALEILARQGQWRAKLLKTNSAFLRPSTLPAYLGSLASLAFRRRTAECAWVQFGSLPDLSFVVLARLRGYHVLVTPHLGAEAPAQARPLFRRLSRAALGLAHRLALISRSQEEELDLGNLPRSHIRTFLPAESFAERSPDGVNAPSLRLVHAARLSEGKGSFLMVDVCARLRDAKVPFTARIIGGAEPEVLKQIEERIAELRLVDEVRLLGPLSVPEVMEELRRSDVLVHLSRQDSYPLIVLEALACSAVPICLDLPGARSMVETYAGEVVGQERPAEEAARILGQVDLPGLRRRAREASIRVRQDHDWNRSGAALDAAIRAVIEPEDRRVAASF